MQNKFVANYKPTIGADFLTKDVLVGEQLVALQCWDTAGQEKYRSLSAAFYKGANCCVLVYDITDNKSFADLEEWKERFLSNSSLKDPKVFPFVVIANKSDLEKSRKVTTERAENWCKEGGKMPFFETSAITADLNPVFHKVAEIALANYNGIMYRIADDLV